MLTTEELAGHNFFSGLPEDVLAALARGAGDIHLGPGEFVAHEGEAPALFVVLTGSLEVVKLIDGIERRIGMRAPGQIFGEIPLVYGTQFQGAYRALEASRVARVEGRSYYDVAAASPDLARRIGEIARERIGGLQGIAAEKRAARVMLVGCRWDTATQDIRRFLARNQITFEWLVPDDPELPDRWSGAPPDEADTPVVRLVDGSTLVQPRSRQLADLLGLQTTPGFTDYDTVIIGGGPAGLAAAVYGASEGLRTIVVEREAPGGQAETSSRIENYLGFPAGISGDELASRALRQARRLGAEIVVSRQITRGDPEGHTLQLDGGEVLSWRTIIIATGVSWRRLAVDGVDRLIGKGLYYGAARSEASATQGHDVHLVGAGNSAGQAALFFANHARTVTIVVRGDSLEKSMSQYLVDQIRGKTNIRVALRSEIQAVHGERSLAAVDLIDRGDGAVRREESGGLFVFIGADAQTDWLPPAIARDPRGYVLTGAELVRAGRWHDEARDPYLVETSIPGVFACGDVRLSPVKRVAAAVGEGSMAIAFVHQYLHGLPARH